MDQVGQPAENKSQAPDILLIDQNHWDQMLAHIESLPDEEACGLIGGYITSTGAKSEIVVPITNVLHCTNFFKMDPQEQIDAFMFFEESGFDLLAIYHSHPNGLSVPSPTDIKEAFYPDAIYLIWSKQGSNWDCQGYTIQYDNIYRIQVHKM
jgi:proteasome lid subunit RPN8/RPN11